MESPSQVECLLGFLWHQKFLLSKVHTLADQVVALQICFRSPVLTSKLPFCYALNPVMISSRRLNLLLMSLAEGWAWSLGKLSWNEKPSGFNLPFFLWHLLTGEGFIQLSAAPLPARTPRGAEEDTPATSAPALLPAHWSPSPTWLPCLGSSSWGDDWGKYILLGSPRPQGTPRKSQRPSLGKWKLAAGSVVTTDTLKRVTGRDGIHELGSGIFQGTGQLEKG